MSVESEKGLELAIASIEKQHGKGAIMDLSQKNVKMAGVEFTPTGSLALDNILGGGYAKGRIVEIYGPESSGKTTLAIQGLVGAYTVDDRRNAFIDAEHSLDINYAHRLGWDDKKTLVAQPNSAEEALEIVDMLVSSGGISMAVIDSVAALVPQKELEGEMGEPQMGLQARLMSQAMRKLAGKASKAGTTLIFLNQIRMKIGVMFGNPETTTGGNALKFYASQRLDIRRRKAIEDRAADAPESEDAAIIGNITEVKCVKNKVASPFRSCEFNILYGKGIDWATDLLSAAENAGVIVKDKNTYKFSGNPIGVGLGKTISILRSNPDLVKEIKTAIITI